MSHDAGAVGPQEIYSLLVPLAENRLLVPRANIAEVTSYREPEPYGGSLPWLLGAIEWDGERIPLLSFEGASGGTVPKVAGRTRIVLFRTLTDALPSRYFGVLTQGFPQLVRVNAMVLKPLEEQNWPETGPVLCQVRMVNQTPLIPDIEKLELMIADAIAVAS